MLRLFNQYVSSKTVLLAALETLVIAASLVVAIRLRYFADPEALVWWLESRAVPLRAVGVVLLIEACLYANGLYERATLESRRDEIYRLGEAMGAACILMSVGYFVLPPLMLGRGVLLLTVILSGISILLVRVCWDRLWPSITARRVLIFGSGPLALAVVKELDQRGDLNARLVGFLAEKDGGLRKLAGHPVLGGPADLEEVVAAHGADRIIVALEDYRGALPIRELVRLRVSGVRIEDAHTALASLTGRVWLETIRPSWFVFSDGFRRSYLGVAGKRAVDLAFGIAGLVVLLPLLALIALAIKLDSRGPVLYRQVRVGRGGRTFRLLKFRSMRTDAEALAGPQWAAVDDPRVTRIGRLLRRLRLDELPQFVNVIRGQMSFVGPRPERPEFVRVLQERLPYYDERHSLRPGVTGWAQVRCSYAASIEDSLHKLEYDLFYLKNRSFLFDCAIILETIRSVLFARGSR